MSLDPDRLHELLAGPELEAERERLLYRRVWAAIVLSHHSVDVYDSIWAGRPVLAGSLDGVALRYALRGMPLPHAESYFRVRLAHLDAIAEAEPLLTAAARRDGKLQ